MLPSTVMGCLDPKFPSFPEIPVLGKFSAPAFAFGVGWGDASLKFCKCLLLTLSSCRFSSPPNVKALRGWRMHLISS